MTAADYKARSTDCAEETSQHIQCEGHLLQMDSVVSNGCSKEQPPEVINGSKGFCHQATLFIKLYDKKEARMRDLLSEIQEIGINVKKWDTKSKWSLYTGLVSAAVTVGAGLAVPFAGGVGFAITAALTSVSAGGAVFGFKIKQFRTEEESLNRIKQFLKIVNRLQHELEELMKLCENLQRGSEKVELQDITSLKNNLVKLFQATDKFRAADGVIELTTQCQTVFDEFENMRKQLEEFRGSTESENTQTELVIISETSSESAACGERIKENSTLDSANEKLLSDAGSKVTEDTQTELVSISETSSESAACGERIKENSTLDSTNEKLLTDAGSKVTEDTQTELVTISETSSESAACGERIKENSTLDSTNEKLLTDAGSKVTEDTQTEMENSSELSSFLPKQQDNVVKKTRGLNCY